MNTIRALSSIFTFSVCTLISACATKQLGSSTISTGRTANDILYAMVLENLEMIKQNNDALPWHIKITQGSITVNDSFTPTTSYSSAAAITKTLQLAGTQSAQVSWTVVPVVDKQTLNDLQGVYVDAAKRGDFSETYSEDSDSIGGMPCGSFGEKKICVKNMGGFTRLVMDVLTKTTVSASERGVQLPGPAVVIP